MRKATYPLKLPKSIKVAAARLAKEDGVSLTNGSRRRWPRRWARWRLRAAFFARRAGGATGEGLLSILDKAPDVPPAPDDVLPDPAKHARSPG